MRRRRASMARPGLCAGILAMLAASCAMAFGGRSATGAGAADGAALIQTAQKQFHSGNYSASIATLESAVAQNANGAEAYYWLGRDYYELKDYDNAIAQAERAVQLDPSNSVYHQWLGRSYGEKADKERSFGLAKKVKKEFQEAVRLDPKNLQARRDLEEYCIEAPWIAGGSKDEAKAQVEAIAAVDPVEGHLARATFDEGALKKMDLAEAEYREVLKAKPNRIEPYLEAVNFFGGMKKLADMDEAIAAAAQVAPTDARLEYYRGAAKILEGQDFAHAEEYLKAYIASTPERSEWPSHGRARDWLGRLYEAEGKRTEAAEQYRAALQLEPGRKDTKERLEKLEKASH
jgi:tetratricopeptide (TPR) repeat protein